VRKKTNISISNGNYGQHRANFAELPNRNEMPRLK
jgi:hypothetical protein